MSHETSGLKRQHFRTTGARKSKTYIIFISKISKEIKLRVNFNKLDYPEMNAVGKTCFPFLPEGRIERQICVFTGLYLISLNQTARLAKVCYSLTKPK